MVVTPLICLYYGPSPSMVVRPVVRFAVAWEGSVLLVPVLFEPGHVDASRLETVVNTTMATPSSIGGDANDRKPEISKKITSYSQALDFAENTLNY